MISNLFNWFSNPQVESLSSASYYLNDPSTPSLIEEQVLPIFKGHPSFAINESFKNCQITLCRSLNYFQSIVDNPIKKWVDGPKLIVNVVKSREINAYYDRRSLRFLSAHVKKMGRIVDTSNSAEIVAHELGHALLDCLRPQFWNTQNREIWAFHEAFGDINAIVTTLQSDVMIRQMLEETGGDLKKSNCVSRIAEEMGQAWNSTNYLRDVSVVFDYVQPNYLPHNAPEKKLSSEGHSFSRVFSGAWYEIFCQIFELEKKQKTEIDAVKSARDIAYRYFLKATQTAPILPKFFESIAKSMVLVSDVSHKGLIEKVFFNRKILRPIIKMLSSTTPDVAGERIQERDLLMVKQSQVISFKLNEHFISSLSGKRNPLYDLTIEAPMETLYVFENGILKEEILPDFNEVLEDCQSCIETISANGIGRKCHWQIKNKKLVRNYLNCRVGLPFLSNSSIVS